MRYRLLGPTGLRVSEICLGAMTFGEAWGTMGASKADAREMFGLFADRGGNFVDTANNYQEGESERLVGEFVRAERDRFVVATKYTLSTRAGDPNAWGNHRKNLVRSVEASLKRLGSEYVDLLWVHIWDFTTPVEEVARALETMVRSGKVLHVGASDTPAWVMAEFNAIAGLRGWSPFAAMQVEYSLLERAVEAELVPLARARDLAVLAWAPLAGGVLTGKYRKGAPDSGRAEWNSERLGEQSSRVVDEVLAIAAESGRSPAQVALNWLVAQDPRIIPIVGARRPEQLKDALGAVDGALAPEHVARLSAVSAIAKGFPASMWDNSYVIDNFVTRGAGAIEGWRKPF